MADPIRITPAAHPRQLAQFGRKLTQVRLPAGLPPYEVVLEELEGYCQVLLGREDPPLDSPYLSLAEIAAAYHGRAREIEMMILTAEQAGDVTRGDKYYHLRTGQLRSFIEMAKRMYDLGSRRLTQEDLITRQRLEGGERF